MLFLLFVFRTPTYHLVTWNWFKRICQKSTKTQMEHRNFASSAADQCTHHKIEDLGEAMSIKLFFPLLVKSNGAVGLSVEFHYTFLFTENQPSYSALHRIILQDIYTMKSSRNFPLRHINCYYLLCTLRSSFFFVFIISTIMICLSVLCISTSSRQSLLVLSLIVTCLLFFALLPLSAYNCKLYALWCPCVQNIHTLHLS